MNRPATSHAFTHVFETLSHDYLQGKEEVLRLSVIALLVGGHILVEDLPGLGKTTVALALAGSNRALFRQGTVYQ